MEDLVAVGAGNGDVPSVTGRLDILDELSGLKSLDGCFVGCHLGLESFKLGLDVVHSRLKLLGTTYHKQSCTENH